MKLERIHYREKKCITLILCILFKRLLSYIRLVNAPFFFFFCVKDLMSEAFFGLKNTPYGKNYHGSICTIIFFSIGNNKGLLQTAFKSRFSNILGLNFKIKNKNDTFLAFCRRLLLFIIRLSVIRIRRADSNQIYFSLGNVTNFYVRDKSKGKSFVPIIIMGFR